MGEKHAYAIDPPGVFIEEELEARNWLKSDLAFVLGMSVNQLSPILSGKRAITPRMAKMLAEAFDVEAEFFTNLQNAYDLAQAEEPSEDVAIKARLQNEYPVREMIKRGWLTDDGPTDLLIEQIKRFFLVGDIETVPRLSHAAKKSSKYGEALSGVQLAWLYRAHHVAMEIFPSEYSSAKLRSAVGELLVLRGDPEEIRHVPRILNEAGVRFALVEALPGSKIDGACFWLDKNMPVIAMSLRYDRLDNFWFVLRHEIEHVLRGHGKSNKPIVDEAINSDLTDLPDEEVVANAAAEDFCVPKEKMDSFYLRKQPYISNKDVKAFAARMGVHPALVVGQVHHRNKRYHTFKEHLVSVRSHILPSAVVDGWGEVAPIEL